MNQIDLKFSSHGLLTYRFEMKFKKVLLFLETIDDPELFFYISNFLEIDHLLALLSTCKKLNALKNTPIIEVRILRQKIRILETPREPFNSLSLLPTYHQFFLHKKQDEKQIPKHAEAFFKTYQQYKKAVDFMKKKKQLALNNNLQLFNITKQQNNYQASVAIIEKQIQEQSKFNEPAPLSKQPEKKTQKPRSFVEKFRQEYAKVKQFQRKQNVRHLQEFHKNQSEKIRLKRQIQTPFKTIPIIQIKPDDKLSVVSADSFYKNSAIKYLNRVKTIFGLNLY